MEGAYDRNILYTYLKLLKKILRKKKVQPDKILKDGPFCLLERDIIRYVFLKSN